MFLAASLSGTSQDGFSGSGLRARPVTVSSPRPGPRARRRVLALVGDEAAVDEDDAAVGDLSGV